jgi:hypothetical protein
MAIARNGFPLAVTQAIRQADVTSAFFVIPAQAGIQERLLGAGFLLPQE